MTYAIHFSSLHALTATFVNLLAAFLLGALIGIERQWRQRTAGLRTNTLVSVGAAIFVSLGARLYEINGGSQTTIHIVAYVVSGIGFLGAGAIMKEGASISGLNTAATLWGSGAVGACAGSGLLGEAALAALFVLASNTLLRPVVNQINRSPFREEVGEATYQVFAICSREARADVQEAMEDILEAANYPPRQIEDEASGDDAVELAFTLYATAVQSDELDLAVEKLERLPGVQQAFWTSGEDR